MKDQPTHDALPTEDAKATLAPPAAPAAEAPVVPDLTARRPSRENRYRSPAHAGLAGWLSRHHVSLALTSYQTGRLYLIGVDNQHRVAFHERFLARAMGLWADPQRLVVSTLFQIWRFENVVTGKPEASKPDRHYVPRVAHTTGDLDIHDVSVMNDGRIVFVNSALLLPGHLKPSACFPPVVEAAVYFQARGGRPLSPQRARPEGWGAGLCNRHQPVAMWSTAGGIGARKGAVSLMSPPTPSSPNSSPCPIRRDGTMIDCGSSTPAPATSARSISPPALSSHIPSAPASCGGWPFITAMPLWAYRCRATAPLPGCRSMLS